jgi:hypothetical protein
MSSVWVCRHSSIRTYFENIMQVEMTCMDKNGLCLNTGKPCDAVEYAPVVRGRWVHCDYTPRPDDSKFYNGEMYRCSNCERQVAWIQTYCPSCGAKMEG